MPSCTVLTVRSKFATPPTPMARRQTPAKSASSASGGASTSYGTQRASSPPLTKFAGMVIKKVNFPHREYSQIPLEADVSEVNRSTAAYASKV